MSHKPTILFLLFLFAIPLVNGQVKSNGRMITIFLQKDSLPKRQYGYEKYDKSNNIIERARFSKENQSIEYIEKFYSDSINRITLYTETWLTPNKLPYTSTRRYSYNENGRKKSTIYTSADDTVIAYFTYNNIGRLESSKTIALESNKFKHNWTGYNYFEYNDKDSCIRVDAVDLSNKYITYHDSIIYTDSSKIKFQHNRGNELSGKIEYIYYNGQLVRQLEYELPIMSSRKEFYLDREIIFEYNNGILVRKVVNTSDQTGWCGVGDPEKREIYTYIEN